VDTVVVAPPGWHTRDGREEDGDGRVEGVPQAGAQLVTALGLDQTVERHAMDGRLDGVPPIWYV
jgi:hypothetical protein